MASVLYTELVDHGLLRHFWTNEKEIDDGVFRANQPNKWRLKRFKEKGGVSVVNLRGAVGMAPVVLEEEDCKSLGLKYHWLPLVSTELPSVELVSNLIEGLRDAPRPLLMHCKSGADRCGLASGIYLMAFKGVSPREAVKQLSWRHAHNRYSKKGNLRRFFEQYQPAFDQGRDFIEWVHNEYDPLATAEIKKQKSVRIA